jgi:hypothetical protein
VPGRSNNNYETRKYGKLLAPAEGFAQPLLK